ncbi:hypothetical protein F5146DRAFT_939012 [Armillaria mellea]|nr:hypothetical protein F5146DRAFT_939012 [Armillaria mellea]
MVSRELSVVLLDIFIVLYINTFFSAGVRKTIMASVIFDHLQSLNHKKKTLVLSIFCDYQSATIQTIPNLLCCLLKQLVQDNSLSHQITLLYKQYCLKGIWPSLDVLIKTLSQELASFDHVYIVLDALDEFTSGKSEEQMDKQEELIKTIKLLGNNIHLLVTSRDIVTIRSLFKADIRLDIQAANDDIHLYIISKLSGGHLARFIKRQDELQQEILNGVTEKANGMFLLAGLHMDSLAQTNTFKMPQAALRKLPDNIASAYDKTLKRINSQGKDNRKLAYCIFGWIAFTRCPLSILELQHALAVELDIITFDFDNLYDKDILKSICGGLILVDQTKYNENPIVKFIHK